MNAETQAIVTVAIIAVTAAVFAVKIAIRIRKSMNQTSDSAGCGGSCGCVKKFKVPTK